MGEGGGREVKDSKCGGPFGCFRREPCKGCSLVISASLCGVISMSQHTGYSASSCLPPPPLDAIRSALPPSPRWWPCWT